MISVRANQQSFLTAQEQLQVMMLPAAKRKRIIQKLNRHLVKTNRQNIRANRDPDGKAWKQRKNGSKKMMRKMAKQMRSDSDSNQGTIYFLGDMGVIAARHHEGETEKWTASKAEKIANKRFGQPNYKANCTRNQAKRLRTLGYTIPAKRKGKRKKPSLKWITENLTLGQAGVIIRMMKDKKKTGKSSWESRLPARKLLGAKQQDVAQFISKSLKEERR